MKGISFTIATKKCPEINLTKEAKDIYNEITNCDERKRTHPQKQKLEISYYLTSKHATKLQ